MNIYKINNEKFKSIYLSYNFTLEVKREDISYFNVLASILGKSNNKYKTQKDIEEYLYSLYGANFDVNVEKIGDLFNIEFKMQFINSKFLPDREDLLDKVLDFIYSVVYDPVILNNKVDIDLIEREKVNVLEKILTRKDDKLRYAVNRTEEILCENEPFGTYIYGDEEIVKNVKLEDLIKYYNKMINEGLVTIILSGNLSGYTNISDRINEKFEEKLNKNNTKTYQNYNVNNKSLISDKDIKEIVEKVDTAQSVITMGFKIEDVDKSDFFALNVYNAILGATPSSKLFQNFREKESLAYTVRSRYYRYKDLIIIYAGIENSNYERAKEVLKKEIKQIENGNISLQEFDAAKESLISELLEIKDSKVALAKMLMSNLFYYNENVDVEEFIENIKKVNVEDVINVSHKIKLKLIYLLGGEANE